jgi:hypothetical protein
LVKSKEEIRPDSDKAPPPVAELGEIARVNATGEPPDGPAKEPLLDAAEHDDTENDVAPDDMPRF